MDLIFMKMCFVYCIWFGNHGQIQDLPLRVWNKIVYVGADSISALGMQDNIADGWELDCGMMLWIKLVVMKILF